MDKVYLLLWVKCALFPSNSCLGPQQTPKPSNYIKILCYVIENNIWDIEKFSLHNQLFRIHWVSIVHKTLCWFQVYKLFSPTFKPSKILHPWVVRSLSFPLHGSKSSWPFIDIALATSSFWNFVHVFIFCPFSQRRPERKIGSAYKWFDMLWSNTKFYTNYFFFCFIVLSRDHTQRSKAKTTLLHVCEGSKLLRPSNLMTVWQNNWKIKMKLSVRKTNLMKHWLHILT